MSVGQKVDIKTGLVILSRRLVKVRVVGTDVVG